MSPNDADEPPSDDPKTPAEEANPDNEEPNKEEAPDWLLDNIAELSQNARSIYLIYLGFLAYCAVTIVGTTDRQILLDESVRLPIVGVDVSFTGFFVIAPLVAIGTFVYLQLYLQRLKQLKEKLRTEYVPVDTGRLYPWMLNVVDDPNPGLVGIVQRVAVKLVLWGMLPIVLFLFAFWYLKAQDPFGGWVVVLVMPTVGSATVLYFWHQYEDDVGSLLEDIRNDWTKWLLVASGTLSQAILLYLFVPPIFGRAPAIGFDMVTIDVSYQSLVTEREHAQYWVNLSDKRLNGANLTAATLTNANLRNAELKGAYLGKTRLDSADLWKADLEGADLPQARLVRADLQRAYLKGANLEMAHLSDAVLYQANLEKANLSRAQLNDADLSHARLSGANLSFASMRGVNLQYAQLDSVDLFETTLDSTDLQGVHVKEANFMSTQLEGAELQRAELHNVEFWKANLSGAVLASSREILDTTYVVQLDGSVLNDATIDSLRCIRNGDSESPSRIPCARDPRMRSSVIDALCDTRSLEGATLDSLIRDGVEQQCPSLLKGISP